MPIIKCTLNNIDPFYIGDQLAAEAVAVFGIINLMTAILGSNPIYDMAGISTYPSKTSVA